MSNGAPTLSWQPPPQPVASPLARRRWHSLPWIDPGLKVLIPVLVIVFVLLAAKFGSFQAYMQLLSRQTYTAFLPALGAAYTLVMLIFQLGRTALWARYRPYPPAAGPLPHLTVIIPAQRRYPHLLRPMRFAANRGKKEGLYTGFTRGRGEVFVTIDSDSIIAPDALRHLVAPLLHDGLIGAVAGNVKVYNRNQSLMGKMQGVRFVNLDYLRASQSLYRAVVCTPGSLSAYRRTALMPHLTAWRHQTFLGAPCHHSEDRALTNFILRGGHYTYYQRTALVYTLVPETYQGVCRMYLRWERGNVRESLVQLGYLFTRYRKKYRLLPIVEFFLAQLEYPLTLLFFGLLLASVAVYPLILIKLLAALGVASLLNLVYYLWLERDLDFVYGGIYSYYAFFLLQWIYPYACLTVRNRHWLTR